MKITLKFLILIFPIITLSQRDKDLIGFWEQKINTRETLKVKSNFYIQPDSVVYNTNYINDSLISLYIGKWEMKSNEISFQYNESYNRIITGYFKRNIGIINGETYTFKLNRSGNKLTFSHQSNFLAFIKSSAKNSFLDDFHKFNIHLMFESSESYFFNQSVYVTNEIQQDIIDYYENVFFDKEDRRMFILYRFNDESNLLYLAEVAFKEKDYWLAYWYYRLLYLRDRDDEFYVKAMLSWNLNNNPVIFR